jgi:hypothetical protein
MEVKDIIDTLTAVNQHITSAQRELLQLTLRLQHVAEGEQNVAALAQTTENLQAVTQAVQETTQRWTMPPADTPDIPRVQQLQAGADWQARRFTGDEGKPAATAPSMAGALETAKNVLKDALRAAGQSQLVDMVDDVSEDDLKRVHAVAEQPTPVDGPTPAVPVVTTHEKERERASLASFIGPQSVFVGYLNGDTIQGGKGRLGKGTAALARWQEDAYWIDEARLKNWPSGFYQNRDSKVTQLLINTERAAILVDGLPSQNARVFVMRYGAKAGFESMETLPLLERARVIAYIETKFKSLLEEVDA